MTMHRIPPSIPPELSEEYDAAVEDAYAWVQGTLPEDKAAAMRARMETDVVYRRAVNDAIEFFSGPPIPLEPHQARLGLEDLQRRIAAQKHRDSLESARHEAWERTRIASRRKRIVAIAAGILILLAAPMGVSAYLEHAYYTTVATNEVTNADVALPDGSTARLEPSSEVRYLKSFTSARGTYRREVDLEGTAVFDVRSVGSSYFSVTTPQGRVVAVGTTFRVSTDAAATAVEVMEGRVTVQAHDSDGAVDGPVATLHAGWRARLSPAGGVMVDSTGAQR